MSQGGLEYDDNYIAACKAREAQRELTHKQLVEHERKLSVGPEVVENPRTFDQLEANVIALAHQICYSKWSYMSGDSVISVDAEAFRKLLSAVRVWNEERVK